MDITLFLHHRPDLFLLLLLILLSAGLHPCDAAQGPALVITDLAGDEELYPGYPCEGTVILENTGDQTSGITTLVTFLKDPDTGDNATISSLPVDPVRPGENRTIPFIGTVDVDLPAGNYHLYAVLPEMRNPGDDQTGTIARLSTRIPVIKKFLPDQKNLEYEVITRIREETNEYRNQEGLSPLEWDDALAAIAGQYARNISSSRFLSHTDTHGDGPAERASLSGYPTTKPIEGGVRVGIAENLAYIGTGMVTGAGYVDPTNGSAIAGALMKGWMESPGHRQNIMDPLSDRFGVGLFWNGEYYYAVSEFW